MMMPIKLDTAASTHAVLLAVLLAWGASARADESATRTAPDPERGTVGATHGAFGLTHLLERADEAYRERRDPSRAREALWLYSEARALAPQDVRVAWRFSMASYFMGMRNSSSKQEQQRYWREGRDAGLAGADLEPRCAECHFWGAINMALYGDSVGVVKMLFTLSSIRSHLRQSADLDPSYAYGGAYRVLALIDQKLPGILGGSKKRARAYLEQAVTASPDEPLNYLFLAQLLVDRFDDQQGALAVARRGLAVPTPAPERIESIDALPQLREFVERYGGDGRATGPETDAVPR